MSLIARARKGIDQAASAETSYHVSTIPIDYRVAGEHGLDPTYAVNVMTVYQCVRALTDAFAQLPLMLYRREGMARVKADDHPLYRTFHDAPNPTMSSTLWRRIFMGHLATWGNAYNEIRRLGNGDVELWPIRPDRIEVRWADGGNRRDYWYLSPSGQRTLLREGSVFHVQGFSSDGLVGIAPISAMRRAIGLYRKAEKYGESVFDNGARPAIVMSHPKTLSDPAITRLGAQMDQLRGAGNSGKTVILEEGLDIHEIGFPPEDAQFMETRLFQKREIVNGFGLPLSLSGDPEFASVKVEEKLSELFQWSMPAHFQSFQQEAQLQVIDDPDLYVEFLTDALMWADPKARADALAVEWEHGNISNDEWRAVNNKSPLPDGLGQVYYRPANWVRADEEAPQPVGGDASRETQFGQGAELVDQMTRAKALGFPKPGEPAMSQFDCPSCGKMVNRMAAPGTIGYCKGCRAEVTMGSPAEVAA
jgi:HK97 family phage portal protein